MVLFTYLLVLRVGIPTKNNPLPGSRGYMDLSYSLIQVKPKPYRR